MPYIQPEFRDGAKINPVGAGELNYQITLNVIAYLQKHGWNYSNMNVIVGTLDNVKHEFQRRVMDPYEDTKIVKHGDVYPQRPR